MNVAEFIREFRDRTDDIGPQFLWSDREVLGYLNASLDDACERARLIEDWRTPACCELTLVAGQDTYQLHPSVLEVKHVRRADGYPLDRTSVEAEYESDTRWEIREGEPRRFIEGEGTIRLVRIPDGGHAGEVLKLTVYRRQLEKRTLTGDTSGPPDISERFHERILDGMLQRAYSKPDAETINKVAAAQHDALFERSFGPRVSASVQRQRRDRRPPIVRCSW